ncbi:zinc finger BED domain-containing protein 4-like isoform X8 [Brienomyrus brachyistius]|uniref:zinc finger BED domain-containing protein 4-like isoform X8 n=1 Tax=Brienomyrus brachyistius TaxID=42636 RepID=UPI0020B42038|nr:zinc finger BED domain-containing protein 4-like isoform X8 [Brienomyrus brachyistius]
MSAWSEETEGANDVVGELHPPEHRIRSAVWTHFGFRKKDGVIIKSDWPICRACGRAIPTKAGSTSNLIHHLRERHPSRYAAMQNMKHPELLVKSEPIDDPVTPNQTVIETMPAEAEAETSSKWEPMDTRQVALTDSIVTYIVNGLLPLSTVENKDFIAVLQLAEPLFIMPSRRDLTQNLIPQRTTSVKYHLINQMHNAYNICLTVDLWSNRSMRSFFGMTGNFISNFTLQNVTLSCQRFKGRLTAENICGMYEDILSTYDIKNKVSFIVTDSASNLIKAFNLFPPVTLIDVEEDEQDDTSDLHVVNIDEEIMYFPPERSPCFVYTLQLVVRDALDQVGSIKNLLDKIQKLVSFCHKSPVATEILGDYKIYPGNAAHWNSQLKVLKSVLNIPSYVLAQLECPVQLSPTEFKIIQELCVVLEPFGEVTDRCQAEKVVTSSLVIPCVRGLRHAVKNMKMTGNNNLVSILQSLVEKHLAKFEDIQCFQMASTLDPRFKLDWCTGEEVNTIKDLLIGKVECLSPKFNAGYSDWTAQPVKRPKLFSYMESQTSPSDIAKATRDVIVYLSQPCLAEDADPLAYWKGNQTSFPELARLACKYLAIPASSAPVEKIFRAAGSIFKSERGNLNDKTFEDLLLIKCNSTEQ